MAAMVHPKDSQGSPVPLSKPATPGAAKSHLATASRNLSPQLGQLPFSSSPRSSPSNHSPSAAAVASPASKISPMQRLCNQAVAVMELARGYQRDEQNQAHGGAPGYTSSGRLSNVSIPDLIPFDAAQPSPPRGGRRGVPALTLAAVDQVDESRGRDAAFGSELKPSRATVEEYQPGAMMM
ncbi:MAG: hypothetical protein WDW36_005613 [Sanguina aurantia]